MQALDAALGPGRSHGIEGPQIANASFSAVHDSIDGLQAHALLDTFQQAVQRQGLGIFPQLCDDLHRPDQGGFLGRDDIFP